MYKLFATALSLAILAATPVLASENEVGEKLWLQCKTCHTLKAGQPNGVGPNLNKIIGAKAGSRAGFKYSPQLKASGLVWNDATLDSWIANPRMKVKGTRMVFVGIPDAAKRKALIAYLKHASK
jgi:cytochrome c